MAIFLTTVSTVGGLLPLIAEQDLQAKFLIPMAVSLAAGVLFATVLTLIIVPTLYAIFFAIGVNETRANQPADTGKEPAGGTQEQPS